MVFFRAIGLTVLLFGFFCATGCFEGVARQDSNDRDNAVVREAISLEKQGKGDLAVQRYLSAVEIEPQNAVAHLNMAILLDDSKKSYLKAMYHYQRYLELRPNAEKKEMIENRFRLAGQALGAQLAAKDPGLAKRIADLEKENQSLAGTVQELTQRLFRYQATEEQGRRGTPIIDKSSGMSNDGSERSSPSSGAANMSGARTYVVQRGDSLSIIAAKVYNDQNKWDRIYEANRKVLEKSNTLRVGQVLVIP